MWTCWSPPLPVSLVEKHWARSIHAVMACSLNAFKTGQISRPSQVISQDGCVCLYYYFLRHRQPQSARRREGNQDDDLLLSCVLSSYNQLLQHEYSWQKALFRSPSPVPGSASFIRIHQEKINMKFLSHMFKYVATLKFARTLQGAFGSPCEWFPGYLWLP